MGSRQPLLHANGTLKLRTLSLGAGCPYEPVWAHAEMERPPNYGAQLLSAAENQTLFSLLGHDCISLAAGVVQLLKADPDNPRFWTKVHVGVISLVKDYEKRAYFLRLYEIFKKQFTWEQMLYKNFRVSSAPTCPNLLSFEGDECVYGVNFSSREEAINFKHHLDKRYEQEQRSRKQFLILMQALRKEGTKYDRGATGDQAATAF
uniref:WH1 domain-containing protein n=1 Tax=Ascaris lumbricoides TaxID=6252 RepID=A0A0M3HR10_ASCLU